jgi:hypothetical protein
MHLIDLKILLWFKHVRNSLESMGWPVRWNTEWWLTEERNIHKKPARWRHSYLPLLSRLCTAPSFKCGELAQKWFHRFFLPNAETERAVIHVSELWNLSFLDGKERDISPINVFIISSKHPRSLCFLFLKERSDIPWSLCSVCAIDAASPAGLHGTKAFNM